MSILGLVELRHLTLRRNTPNYYFFSVFQRYLVN